MSEEFEYSKVNSENAELLKAMINGTGYTQETESRNAAILKSIINNTEYNEPPQSEIEELLLELKEKGWGGDIDLQTLNVTENGTVNAPSGVAYNKVVTDVPQPTLTTLNATENRTYTAPSGTAYNEVDVDVPLPSNAYLLKELSNLPQPIATFNDGSDLPLKSLTASIVPVQSGSGDPSPENIRPFVPWTEEVVTRTGKNLLGGEALAEEFEGSVGYSIDTTNKTFTYLRSKNEWIPNVKFKENTGYTFIITYTGGRNNCFRVVYTDGTTGQIDLEQATEKTVYLVTTPNNKTIKGFDVAWLVNSLVTVYYEESGIFEGTITKDDFEPYAGTTTTIPFTDSQGNPVEVFGGSVDVVNGGEQPRTLKKVVYDGSNDEDWRHYGGNRVTVAVDDFTSPASGVTANIMCDKLNTITKSQQGGTEYVISGSDEGYHQFMVNVGISDITELRTWLSNNPITVVYELATPTTFYTQPTAVKSLDGVNNVFASTGDVLEAEYLSKSLS